MLLDNSDLQIKMNELLAGLLIASIWALFAVWAAFQKKTFAGASFEKSTPIQGSNVLIGFFLFIFMQLLIIPIGIVQIYFLFTGKALTFNHLQPIQLTWINLVILIGAYLSIALYYFKYFSVEKKKAIFGGQENWYKLFCTGAYTWFLIYPVVLVCSLLLDIGIIIFFHQKPLEQYVVDQFRTSLSEPALFMCLGFTIAFLVPVAEEFLFRGLLQSWLKKKMNSPIGGMIIAAIIFSLFHYSFSQGITNIQLLLSLFLLGCFLGFLYEKYKSIWASIGLHSMFNLVSVILILLDKNETNV